MSTINIYELDYLGSRLILILSRKIRRNYNTSIMIIFVMMPIDISDLFTEIYRSDENLDFANLLKLGDDEIPRKNA